MTPMRHMPPAPLHGLLSVKRGGQLSRRQHRLAHLENACLALRALDTAPVEWSACIIDARIQPDASNLCIVLSAPSFRIRLYAHSHTKYQLWLRAISASALWKVHNFYQIGTDQVLATGQFATVYKARDAATQTPVAVKYVPLRVRESSVLDQAYLTELVQRECRISRLVDHRSIVTVYDVFEEPDCVYIVMQYCEYTLQDVMNCHTLLTEMQAACVMRQLLDGIAYLHNRNIVHRDLKPDNILCSDLHQPMRVQICDFGIANFTGKRAEIQQTKRSKDERAYPKRARNDAKLADDGEYGVYNRPIHLGALIESMAERKKRASIGFHQKEVESAHAAVQDDCSNSMQLRFGRTIDGLMLTSAIGAPSYVAPELVKGQRYGKPVDIWACGVLLFFMLCGYLPFEGRDAGEVARKIKECDLDLESGAWSRVSDEAKLFVRCLLQVDPLKRVTLECALENEWLEKGCEGSERELM